MKQNLPTGNKRPGNPNMKRGSPSVNPRGKRKGVKDAINAEVMDAVHHALNNAHPDGAKGYFLELAQKDKSIFMGVVQKILPTETAVSVVVSLGDAMTEAQRRVAELEAKMIDITPEVAEPMTFDAKSLKTNDD